MANARLRKEVRHFSIFKLMKGLVHMNYLKEINAFHARQETEPLTMAAAYLWIVLMDINNRAGWKKQFTVAVSLLCAKTSLKEGTFKRARNELQKKGYIHVESQGANRAAMYQMISLQNNKETTREANDDRAHDGNDDGGSDHSNDHTNAPLFKQNETKQKENNTTAAEAIEFYRENFMEPDSNGKIKPYIAKSLLHWANEVGEPLVLVALERTLDQGQTKWVYVKRILQDWKDKGVQTVDDVQAEDAAFKQKREKRSKQPGHSYGRRSGEVVPDWFKERNKKQDVGQEEAITPELSAEEEAEERAELEALLRENSSGG